jgi:hypothetical protein
VRDIQNLERGALKILLCLGDGKQQVAVHPDLRPIGVRVRAGQGGGVREIL